MRAHPLLLGFLPEEMPEASRSLRVHQNRRGTAQMLRAWLLAAVLRSVTATCSVNLQTDSMGGPGGCTPDGLAAMTNLEAPGPQLQKNTPPNKWRGYLATSKDTT